MRWLALAFLIGCGGDSEGDSSATTTGTTTSTSSTSTTTTSTSTSTTTTTTTPTGTTSPTTSDVCVGRAVGTGVGDCAFDFTLEDRDGVAHTLSDFAGSVIVVDFSAMWCPICQNLAPEGQQFWVDHQGTDLVYLTVLFQDASSGDVDASEMTSWIDTFGITHPVLTDPGELVFAEYDAGYQPTIAVIDRDFTIVWVDAGTAARTGYEAEVLSIL